MRFLLAALVACLSACQPYLAETRELVVLRAETRAADAVFASHYQTEHRRHIEEATDLDHYRTEMARLMAAARQVESLVRAADTATEWSAVRIASGQNPEMALPRRAVCMLVVTVRNMGLTVTAGPYGVCQ